MIIISTFRIKIILRKFYFSNCTFKIKMKNLGIPSLIATTLVLITLVIFSSLDFPYPWVFFLTVFGQVLLVFAVYKVLRDDYETDKTFADFYEDYPIGRQK